MRPALALLRTTFRHSLAAGLPLALATAPALFASGTRVGFKDAFAMARGNAFVATADNPSALYYNPAGLLRTDGTVIEASLYEVSVASDYTGAAGSTSLDDKYQAVPAFYSAWHPHGSKWAGGFGVYAPFGLSTEWPSDASSPLRTLAEKSEQTCLTYNLSGAWQIAPQLSLGAGVTYNHVTTDLRRALGFLAPDDYFRFEGSGNGVGFNLGLLWQPRPEHSFGLSYSHTPGVKLSGTASTVPLIASEPADATFAFPDVIIAGWSYRPTPLWNLEVDVDWTNWDRFNTVTIHKPSGDLPLAFNWESGFFYELGVTRTLTEHWLASAGYCYTANSVPDATYTPAVPDSNRSFYSCGLGYRGDRISVDFAWHYGDGGTRRITGSPPSLVGATADGAYDNSINAFSLSAAYRF